MANGGIQFPSEISKDITNSVFRANRTLHVIEKLFWACKKHTRSSLSLPTSSVGAQSGMPDEEHPGLKTFS